MYSKGASGFSVIKFVLIFFAILLLVGGIVAVFYVFQKQTQTDAATSFMNTFVNSVKNGETKESFAVIDSSAPTDDPNGAYYSWLFWSSAFGESGVSIEEPAVSVTFDDASLPAVFGNSSPITYVFSTSADTKVSFTTQYKNSKWVITDYAAI